MPDQQVLPAPTGAPADTTAARPAPDVGPTPSRSTRVRRIPRFEPSPDGPTRRPLAVLTARSRGAGRPARSPVPPAPALVDPAARAGARRVLVLSLEVLDGRRSPAQLRPLLPATLVEMVTTLARTRGPRANRYPATLRTVRVQQVTPHVAEAFATVLRGPRVTAAVARLELTRDGWRCTALRLQ